MQPVLCNRAAYTLLSANVEVLTEGILSKMLTVRTMTRKKVPAAIRRPLYKTLVHGLREVNPEAAAMLEASPRLRNPTKRNTLNRMMMSTSKV